MALRDRVPALVADEAELDALQTRSVFRAGLATMRHGCRAHPAPAALARHRAWTSARDGAGS